MMVKTAPDLNGDGCAGLIIAMGGGEDREHAGSVGGARMAAREQHYLVRRGVKYRSFSKAQRRQASRSLALLPTHPAS